MRWIGWLVLAGLGAGCVGIVGLYAAEAVRELQRATKDKRVLSDWAADVEDRHDG